MAGFMQQKRIHTKSRAVDLVWTLWFLSYYRLQESCAISVYQQTERISPALLLRAVADRRDSNA